MKGTWEKLAADCLSHFHILMARSALHQLRMNKWATPATQKRLEFASLKHQNEAVAILRGKFDGPNPDRKEILLACISLATFEKRYGSPERANLHFKAARDLFTSLGKQTGAHDHLREKQAFWFEGIYADPAASFMWQIDDAGQRFSWLRELLDDVDRIWRNRQLIPLKARKPFVHHQTRLHEFFFRDTQGTLISFYADINETTAQQRCILIYVAVIVSLHSQAGGRKFSTAAADARAILTASQIYTDWIEKTLVEQHLDGKEAVADVLWIMLQDFNDKKPSSTNPAALDALQRFDFQAMHWRTCGIANVIKYLTPHWQQRIMSWLLAFVEGRRYDGRLTLDEFAFSYASQM